MGLSIKLRNFSYGHTGFQLGSFRWDYTEFKHGVWAYAEGGLSLDWGQSDLRLRADWVDAKVLLWNIELLGEKLQRLRWVLFCVTLKLGNDQNKSLLS